MQSITVVTPAADPAVDLDEMHLSLRLNDTSEDDLITAYVSAATDLFTRETGYVPTSTTYRLNLDGWPHTGGTIYIPRFPVTSIISVQYRDTSGNWQTVSSSDYSSDLESNPARVIFGTSYSYPSLHTIQKPAVRVTFVAGHADPADCPALARIAIKLLASHYYGYREAYTTDLPGELPAGWRAVCNQFANYVRGEWNNG